MKSILVYFSVLVAVSHSAPNRCEVNTYQKYPVSDISCTQMGNLDPIYIKYRSGEACLTDNYISASNCNGRKTRSAARDHCKAGGMQLCPLHMLYDTGLWGLGTPRARGCGFTQTRWLQVWSDTPCSNSDPSKYYTYQHRTAKAPIRVCKSQDDLHYFQCCGTHTPTKTCKACPLGSYASGLDSTNAGECLCWPGWETTWIEDGVDSKPECTYDGVAINTCPAGKYGYAPSTKTCDSFASTTDIQDSSSCFVNEPEDSCIVGSKSNRVTHTIATAHCRSKGARVCTKDELMKLDNSNSSPDHVCPRNNRMLWTSTPCYLPGESRSAFYAWDFLAKKMMCTRNNRHKFQGSWRYYPKHRKPLMGAVCCADVESTSPICVSCGEGATSASGSTVPRDCTCSKREPNGECLGTIQRATCAKNRYQSSSGRPCWDLIKDRPSQWKWANGKKACSSVRGDDNSCNARATFDEATAACAAQGAVLCSKKMMMDKRGLFKNHDKSCLNTRFWTSTKACSGGLWGGDDACEDTSGYYTLKASGSSKARIVSDVSSRYGYACCSKKWASSCTKCPKYSTASAGENSGVDSCTCKAGYYMSSGQCIKTRSKTCSANFFQLSSKNWGQQNLKPGKFGKLKIAATSKFQDTACEDMVLTYTQAVEMCSQQGGRLCHSQHELKKALRAINDGCSRLGANMWTSKACGVNKVWTTQGDTNSADVCTNSGGTLTRHTACCFDSHYKKQPRCKRCPSSGTSAQGSTAISDCTCGTGYEINTDGVNSNAPMCVAPET
uniref:Uncharacterized protein n=1 Tax=Mucochytrium quahogii TaxID=96639 RepID=A0A7S2R782_9STRA|mmetsp:Transcript_3520/g.5090  ORF Transcript_3520/g.5090 Transcript_3520/m.5090 type:complete len:780 (+) Transcript_3520:99-2438(+)